MKSHRLTLTFLLISVLVCPMVYSQNIENQDLLEDISELINPFAAKGLFSGVVLVAEGEEIQYHEAFGYSNIEDQVLNEVDNRFGIASITKAFTGVIVEKLVAEGKLDLEDPVEKYISGFPKGPEQGIPKVDHLYNHRAGVPHRLTSIEEESTFFGTEAMVEKVKASGLLFEPGTRRLYSSAGYTVLARVIESIENKPFDQVLAEQIFRPAHMDSAVTETNGGAFKKRARSYFLSAHTDSIVPTNAPHKNLSFLTGAGSVYATTQDLFHFRTAFKNGVFGKDLWEKTIDMNSTRWTGWSGRTNGYWSYLDILPAEDLTLIILTNLGSAPTWKIRSQLQNLLLDIEVEEVEFPPAIVQPFESYESIVGTYDNNGRTTVISLKNGKIYRGDNELYPISEQRYYTLGSGSILKFRRDKSSKVDALVQMRGDREQVFPRID